MEAVLEQFKKSITEATARRMPLRIRGSGSKDWYGQNLHGDILDTRAYHGVVTYDPTELVITVRAGTLLSEVDKLLSEHHQMLAFEPPYFGEHATVGGMVASGLSGPRRQQAGAVRDFVLGAVLINGNGEVLHFGGQVMKNVAGYDVSRLLAGSLGTLGLIVEVSLKVMPKPIAESTLRFSLDQADAIRKLNEWGGQPLPISASAWHDGQLTVRLSGAVAAVSAARQSMQGDEIAPVHFWSDLREHRHPFFTSRQDTSELWRLSVPSVVPPMKLPGEQVIEWGGAQRWLRSPAGSSNATMIRTMAEQAGGHATLFRGADRSVGVFHPLAPTVHSIHRHLKTAFDPSGIFNPGRMYSDY